MNRLNMYARQAQYDDWIRQADMDRLARSARRRTDRPMGLYSAGLAWLGRRLIEWGNRLQQEYDAQQPYGQMGH